VCGLQLSPNENMGNMFFSAARGLCIWAVLIYGRHTIKGSPLDKQAPDHQECVALLKNNQPTRSHSLLIASP